MRQTRTFARFTAVFGVGGESESSSEVLRSVQFESDVPLLGHDAFELDDPSVLYVLTSGEADLFYVRGDANTPPSARRYVGTLQPGDVVAGVVPSAATGGGVILVVGFGDARMAVVPVTAMIDAMETGPRIARALANGLAESIGRAMYRATVAPAMQVEVRSSTQNFARDTALTAGIEVLWFWTDGGALSLGGDTPIGGHDRYFPLARGMWVTITSSSAELSVSDTLSMLDSGTAIETMSGAWAAFLSWTAGWFDREDERQRERLAARVSSDRLRHDRSIASLSGLLQTRDQVSSVEHSEDVWITACAMVCAAANIQFRTPPHFEAIRGGIRSVERHRDHVTAIISTSFIRYRVVNLRGDWWRQDAGPLLGFLKDEGIPVALVSAPSGGYTVHHPRTGHQQLLTAALAAKLDTTGYTFYRPLPALRVRLRSLVQLVLDDIGPDVKRIAVFAIAGSVLGLSMPIVTGKMFSEVIPTADTSNAITLFAALFAVAVGATAFEAARGFAFIRAQSRANTAMQAAIVDRLLSLPTRFFRNFTIGDLATRADAVNAARQLLTGAATTSLLGIALIVTNLMLMLFINPPLGLIAFGVMAVSTMATMVASANGLKHERVRLRLIGQLSSLTFELLNGVAKLHVAAAESRLFSLWAAKYRVLKAATMRAGVTATVLTVFNDVLPTVAAMAVFFVASRQLMNPNVLSTAEFVAFSASFGVALAASSSVSNTLVSLLNIVPTLERVRPILEAVPEVGDSKPDPGDISGRIELSHVTFGYVADAPPIIDDVSIEIRPGEFVAFVGPSGAGKSTVLRLLLGFEKPNTGAVYYDGKDLTSIDIASIRRQSAVVLQQSRLLAGDIFSNIVGASPLSMDDAWRAAELAGFADDIRLMPMEMRTVIGDGGSTLSGGQRQRLLIARALARSPRVVLFDEATSALDNRSQEIVTQSLERLQSTRIVIAHRLSTVMRADRIFVMERGRIVQSGRYDELVEQDGLFRELAERQLV